MGVNEECLLQYISLSGDWTEYTAFCQKLNTRGVQVQQKHKKIVESQNHERFFAYMKSRLGTKCHFSNLKFNGEVLLNDHGRANACYQRK